VFPAFPGLSTAYISTICAAILIKNNKKLCSYIRAIFCINCDYNFNPCGIFESMTPFTPFFNQDWNKEN